MNGAPLTCGGWLVGRISQRSLVIIAIWFPRIAWSGPNQEHTTIHRLAWRFHRTENESILLWMIGTRSPNRTWLHEKSFGAAVCLADLMASHSTQRESDSLFVAGLPIGWLCWTREN